MAGMQKKRSRVQSILSYIKNNKMVKSEVGMHLGIESVRFETGWRFGMHFCILSFELAVEHSGGERAGDSFSLNLGRKSLCWRYWILNLQQWMRSRSDMRKVKSEDRPWGTYHLWDK